MAKSKTPAVKDLSAYFFMGIRAKHIELLYHDDSDRGLAIGAALSSILEKDEKLFDIFSAAMLTALETRAKKKKYTSKKSNKLPKTAKKVANKK